MKNEDTTNATVVLYVALLGLAVGQLVGGRALNIALMTLIASKPKLICCYGELAYPTTHSSSLHPRSFGRV